MEGLLVLLLFLLVIGLIFAENLVKQKCGLFCDGPILDAIQRSHIFQDSKEFVDMPLLTSPGAAKRTFKKLNETQKADPLILRKFLKDHFGTPGAELKECTFEDWIPKPASFDGIRNPVLRNWAHQIHGKWQTLCRQVDSDVLQRKDQHTLLHLPHKFVIPGGRFRELYYWDTYWIVKGFLRADMFTTVKNMILNLINLVDKYGFVPNGSRSYYLQRTQPPLLVPMVYEYFKATNDTEFVKAVLPALDKEMRFWIGNRQIRLSTSTGNYTAYRFAVNQQIARPESYREDLETAAEVSEDDRSRLWSDIAAACESGWDFSSRWVSQSENYRLSSARTSTIVPVDLNAFMSLNFDILHKIHRINGNYPRSRYYKALHAETQKTLGDLFWNDKKGIWMDLDLNYGTHRDAFYASNLIPLFISPQPVAALKAVHYLKDTGALYFPGGLPTSLVASSQQWDRPNGWPPLIHMIVVGLVESGNPEAEQTGIEIATKWIRTNYRAFKSSNGKMFEKYNVEDSSDLIGHGGEYEVQEGFGWTNGVIIDLLVRFGHVLHASAIESLQSPTNSSTLASLQNETKDTHTPPLTVDNTLFTQTQSLKSVLPLESLNFKASITDGA